MQIEAKSRDMDDILTAALLIECLLKRGKQQPMPLIVQALAQPKSNRPGTGAHQPPLPADPMDRSGHKSLAEGCSNLAKSVLQPNVSRLSCRAGNGCLGGSARFRARKRARANSQRI